MNNIITPTFAGHFQNVRIYLKSFLKYAKKESGWQIVFTISSDEESEFQEVIEPYQSQLPIKTLVFEDILERFGVDITSRELLENYGKFSFQTLKKFYTMLFLEGRYFLVLDSESELIRPTSINEVFVKYFDSPFISYSNLENWPKISPFVRAVVDNRNLVFSADNTHWFLENFVWFYDKKILTEMFDRYGMPIDIMRKVALFQNSEVGRCGLFEIDLYQSYIYINNDKYKYRLVDVEAFLKRLSQTERERYLIGFNGDSGLLEHILMRLTDDNADVLAKEFDKNGFNVIRCEKSDVHNYYLQLRFLSVVRPNILAASQNHYFGLSGYSSCNNRFALKAIGLRRELLSRNMLETESVAKCFSLIFYMFKSAVFRVKLACLRVLYKL